MSTLGYVSDGEYLKAVIHEAPGLYPETRFSCRVMNALEFSQHFKAASKLDEEGETRLIAVQMAKRIKSWSLTDGKGVPVIVSELAALNMTRSRFMRVWNVIAGTGRADAIEGQTDVEAKTDIEAVLQAARDDQHLGQAQTEIAAKN